MRAYEFDEISFALGESHAVAFKKDLPSSILTASFSDS
jgi:hypothetical protein